MFGMYRHGQNSFAKHIDYFSDRNGKNFCYRLLLDNSLKQINYYMMERHISQRFYCHFHCHFEDQIEKKRERAKDFNWYVNRVTYRDSHTHLIETTRIRCKQLDRNRVSLSFMRARTRWALPYIILHIDINLNRATLPPHRFLHQMFPPNDRRTVQNDFYRFRVNFRI